MGVIAYVLLSGLSPFAGADHNETFDNITGLKFGFDDPEFQGPDSLEKMLLPLWLGTPLRDLQGPQKRTFESLCLLIG